MLYKKLLILLTFAQYICCMDKLPHSKSQPTVYSSVIPFCVSGVPLLQVLAAQKLHEINRSETFDRKNGSLISLPDSLSTSPEERGIYNEILQENFYHMRKDIAEKYAADLSAERIVRSGSSGRVKQKVLALEIRDKISK